MNMGKYQVFLRVAACGGFTRAAEELHFTQSGVSHTIATLESELGVPLFVRNPGWHLMFDQDAQMAEATRRKVYDMLAAEKMMVQGFHYPFPARAYIEKTSTGYRETMVPWNPTL